MKNLDVAQIQKTFEKVGPQIDRFSAAFYDRLFLANPQLRDLFPEDMTDQRRKLVQALAVMVHQLSNPGILIPMLKTLGVRHVAYGALPAHYATVKTALLEAFSETLGEDFDSSSRHAWSELLDWISAQMLAGIAKTID